MPAINRIIIYSKNAERLIDFYEKHFGFTRHITAGDRMIELQPSKLGASLLIYPAGKGRRIGQSSVKLVFDVEDVLAFREKCAQNGLVFGAVHNAEGYLFSNAKDPDNNSIQISSRAFKL